MNTKIDELISKLASTVTDETLFNPYNQVCKNHDISTAPGLRQGNLRLYLNSHLTNKTDTLLINDSLDYHSTKVTGVPMVEVHNYSQVEKILNLSEHFERANKNGIASGNNKVITRVWELIERQSKPALIWNLLPFYAHSATDISIKKNPSIHDYTTYKEFTHMLISIYKPKVIFAINQNTKDSLSKIGISSKLLKIT